jgi:hypothetical protein
LVALGFSVSVFLFLAVVGYAALALLARDEEPLYRLLLAPVTGMAVTALLLFTGNQLGLPVGQFAVGLAAVLAVSSGIVLWRSGRRIPAKDFWPFVLLCLVALLATGWPMLKYGFDWVSFCNDDMANYCMGAERLLRLGYYSPPGAAALAGSDFTQIMWFLHMLHRPGSELFLAMVSKVTGMGSLRIFMPVVLAFMLCQVSGAAAMTWAASRSRLATWLAGGLMAASALVALGTLYQLIAQVIGLAIAAGLVSVLLRPLHELAPAVRVRHGALIGLLLAGLLIAYTEALPFVGLGYVLYVVFTVRSDRAAWRRALIVLGIAAGVVIVLLNRYVPLATIYVLGQARSAAPENPGTTLFPYYMLPSGPVYFWGMFAIGEIFPADRTISAWIVIAVIISVGSVALVVRSLRRREGPAFVCVVMAAVWAVLFAKHSGFGMYKLAMYFQPFILSAVVLGWISLWRSRIVQVVPIVLLALANVASHAFYTQMSLGLGGMFSEIPVASSTHLVREYANVLASNPGRPIELDSHNLVLVKFQMIESVGRPAWFPSSNFLGNLSSARAPAWLIGRKAAEAGEAFTRAYDRQLVPQLFDLHLAPGSPGPAANQFLLVRDPRPAVAGDSVMAAHPGLLITMTGKQAPFNRWGEPTAPGTDFRAGPPEAFPNHLIFTESALGEPYFAFGRQQVGIYQLEPDPLYVGQKMAGLGRHLLFRVNSPTHGARIELDLTDTLTGDGDDRLPPAAAIGTTRALFPIVGHGSARVLSPPIEPQMIDGAPFVALDMGTDGAFIKNQPGGLMRLWGRNVRLDRRQLVGFVRDISLVSEAECEAFRAPTIVGHFPEDLEQRTLEYSGIYEDGFASDQAFVAVSEPAGDHHLVVDGNIPQIDDPGFTTDAVLTVDGKQVVHRRLPVGEFTLACEVPPAPAGQNRRKVELTFSRIQHLPAPDGRPSGAQLIRIGFVPGALSKTWSVHDLAVLGLPHAGIFADGWMGAEASIRLPQPADARHLVLRAMIPKIDDANFSSDVVLKVDGREVARKATGPGDFEIAADLPAGAGDRNIELSFSKLQQLPAPDTRAIGARLTSIGFERAGDAR